MYARARLVLLLGVTFVWGLPAHPRSQPPTLRAWQAKLDPLLRARALTPNGRTRVIIRAAEHGADMAAAALRDAGSAGDRELPIVRGRVAYIPNAALAALAANPAVEHISIDRAVSGTLERTGATIGATAIRDELGYDGSGIGVAIVDSGITAWHDDLGDGSSQRVDRFVDVTGVSSDPYDDYGHGTHVAGIVAGNGFDSNGGRAGVAPGAHLMVLKALDASGRGCISDVIDAIGYAIDHRDEYNIRVLNLSVAAAVYESYEIDPLTLAARAAVDAGIVVVAAAGNYGRNSQGQTVYGGITAPGNAPWVVTVGASSHMGTADRADDTIAAFSSRGPAAVAINAKPDLVAPGVGIESLSDPNSAFYTTKSPYLLDGTVPTAYRPYLSLSGTSMAAPVVAGTVALMLQANPSLTPNAVKAILQYTSQRYSAYNELTQGTGFLNAKGAVDLAQYFASGGQAPDSSQWSRRILWGNKLYAGGRLIARANAWSPDVTWGDSTRDGIPIVWGLSAFGPWGTLSYGQNVVWRNSCGGDDCPGPWTVSAASDGDTVVWGTADGDTVVWGTGDEGDTVVWGTACVDPSCEPVVWGRQ